MTGADQGAGKPGKGSMTIVIFLIMTNFGFSDVRSNIIHSVFLSFYQYMEQALVLVAMVLVQGVMAQDPEDMELVLEAMDSEALVVGLGVMEPLVGLEV